MLSGVWRLMWRSEPWRGYGMRGNLRIELDIISRYSDSTPI
jgi:hypothetical protein